jgi:multiple sugar transport system substrate-binding protein
MTDPGTHAGAHRRVRVSAFLAAAAATALLGLAACGDDDEGGGGGGGGSAQQAPVPDNAKTIGLDQAQNASGEITFCLGGTLNGHNETIRAFNRESNVTARLIELDAAADTQRTQQIQRLRARSAECDVVAMDVIWTAEYASQGWIYDLTQVAQQRRGEFIPSTLDSATYQDRVWALPINSNAGFLYRRTDQVRQAPANWQQVYQQAAQEDEIVYQGARYEGLTVNFLELLFSAGGTVLNEQGTQSTIDSPQARQVLQFMVDGIRNGAAPRAVTTMQEEEARRAFESGRATFMRNWPYAYETSRDELGKRFDISPFPAFGNGEAAGVLGGYNLGINANSDNAAGALAFVNYYSSPEAQEILATEGSLPPVLTASYDDPQVRRELPFAEDLRQAITQARPRPVSPVYNQISEAIYENVHQALTGRAEVDAAVTAMNQGIQQALETF